MDSLRRVLTPSVFPDDEQTRVARLLHWLLITSIAIDVLDVVLLAIFAPETLPTAWINGLMLVFFGAAFWATRRGMVRTASLLICLPLWVLLSYYFTISGGVMSPAFEFLNLVIIIAAVLLGVRGAIAFGFLSILTTIVLYIGDINGWLVSTEPDPTASRLFATHTVIFASLAVLMGLSGRNVQQWLTRAKRDEHALEKRNQQLQQEITEREHAEQALKLSEERFFKAFQANPTSITISTLDDGRFVDVNDSCLKLLGYTREEMIGHTAVELPTWGNPDDRARVLRDLNEYGTVRQVATQFRRKNGELRDSLVSLEIIELAGKPHLLGMVEDITDSKQVESRLRETQEEFRQLSEAAFEGIVLSEQGRIILSNRQLAEMMGYEPAEIIGMNVMDIVAPESRDLVMEHIRSGYDKPYDHLVIRKDGSIFPVEVRGRLMPYNGRMVRVTAIRDLTQRKQAEQQQLELALQQERFESFKEFLSKISHDLKTPLTVINTSLYLLERLDDPVLQRGKIENIRQQTLLVEKFIQDLLTLSRLEHAPNFTLAPMDVNDLLSQVQTNLHSAAEQHNVRLQFRLDRTIPNVLGDEAELYRALGNLVENAVNYTLSEGSVTVQSFTRDSLVVTEISDTGIGISGQELPHIFERFFRAEEARHVVSNGTGLGLAIVKRIVDIHNGTIEVESTPGIGTTFRVCLPSIIIAADTSTPAKLA